ncbi:hypothetical protein [Shimia abyssi]|uniref:Uncharacterized protein n=1 Tax=Shimia abyssi TaxID=1662395 RepID=A0A2P8ET33_9RHOB|nr:hypothetical protein [Shimia abyssi]PSL12640.1 hypothetical protein CLV88_1384 [Shimia abyssi]
MRYKKDDLDAQKKDFELIAADLEVPLTKREFFLDQALRISDLSRILQQRARYPNDIKNAISGKSLAPANRSLKKTIALLREQRDSFLFLATPDIHWKLVQLLDHTSTRTGFPGFNFGSTENETGSGKNSYTSDMFIGLLALLQEWLEEELTSGKESVGGRPRNERRFGLLLEVFILHNTVFDHPATSAPGGTYSHMCHLLFESFGESTVGLEEAIKRFQKPRRPAATE